MSQLTRKDDIIKLALQTIVELDPDLFALEELKLRVLNEYDKSSNENMKYLLNELSNMLKHHTNNDRSRANAVHSLKLLFKKIMLEQDGDDLVERLFE
jgi:hypothetical protein